MARPCSPPSSHQPYTVRTQGSDGKKGAPGRSLAPLQDPVTLLPAGRLGAPPGATDQAQRGGRASWGRGGGLGSQPAPTSSAWVALRPRVVPETRSRASAGGPRRPSAHLAGPNRTLRSHFKRGRSFSEVSALTFPFHHHPRRTRYPVPVSRNAAT